MSATPGADRACNTASVQGERSFRQSLLAMLGLSSVVMMVAIDQTEVEPALGYEMEGAFGGAFASDGLGPAMFDRIDALAHKIARGSGQPSRISECDIAGRGRG
ncbi:MULTISPECIES: hypothetical protein [Paraburkholderia]|uniref:hypothetical protein n=1 Tax=Paraburkholderia TaxID=1822464 RepID=UPI00037CE81F|nr:MULTISPECIES: hypothetical protein [Paraburkholderia]MDH6148017.1 hypothetical protein [Paraburkholderia sp. WSM4179]